jgi:hypothetical protein
MGVGAAVLVALGLFPPWEQRHPAVSFEGASRGAYAEQLGHAWLFTGPRTQIPAGPDRKNPYLEDSNTRYEWNHAAEVNFAELGVEWLVVLGAISALTLLAPRRIAGSRDPS